MERQRTKTIGLMAVMGFNGDTTGMHYRIVTNRK
jgi:hypothetical protein